MKIRKISAAATALTVMGGLFGSGLPMCMLCSYAIYPGTE
ncbi:hypothetical protein SAMN02910353_02975 [Ruminococcus sp. YRD2003]|nr:hypothetical protein SAMN02910353_02975 [Ruminococcus flavefaciens]